MSEFPRQPIEPDHDGNSRFVMNKLVRYLLENSRFERPLDELGKLDYLFSVDEWRQFYQLIGYSVDGYCDLSFVDDDEANDVNVRLAQPAWHTDEFKGDELMNIDEEEEPKRLLAARPSLIDSNFLFYATEEEQFCNLFDKLCANHWKIIEDLGWHNKEPLEYTALFHEEVVELSRELRALTPVKKGYEASNELHKCITLECADIVLRVMDFCFEFSIPLGEGLLEKIEINSKREPDVSKKK